MRRATAFGLARSLCARGLEENDMKQPVWPLGNRQETGNQTQ